MSSRLPPLNQLHAFSLAARYLSFKRAAEELHVSPAAVGQRIKALERQLDVQLFKRGTRSISLTPTGLSLLEEIEPGLEQINSGLKKLLTNKPSRKLTIHTTPVFAERWLLGRLANFKALHPEINIQINASANQESLSEQENQLAIRLGGGSYPGCDTLPLMQDRYLPVCAPSMADTVRKPNEIDKIPLIHCDWGPDTLKPPSWQDWLARFAPELRMSETSITVSHESLAIEAAITGQGMALVHYIHAAQAIKDGVLTNPLDEAWKLTPKFRYYLLEPIDSPPSLGKTEFKEWLQAELSV